MTRNEKLSSVFKHIWDAFLDGTDLDQFDLQTIIEQCELATWREATENDVTLSQSDLEEGDMILCLNEDGKKSIRIAHLTKLKASACSMNKK